MAVGDGNPIAPAGWYPDPADAARLRRWDGAGWTQDVMFAGAAATAPVAEPVEARQTVAPGPSMNSGTGEHSEPTSYQPSTFKVPSAPGAHAGPSPFDEPGTAAPSTLRQSSVDTDSGPSMNSAPSMNSGTVAPPAMQPVPASPPPLTPPPATPLPTTHAEPSGETPSGSISIPDWASLPGLTLPPDLSAIPGLSTDAVVLVPHFNDERKDEPTPPPVPQPAGSYAPPPSGAQYDAPLPPGASYVPPPGPVLPAASLAGPAAYTTSPPPVPIYDPPPAARTDVAQSPPVPSQASPFPVQLTSSASRSDAPAAPGTGTLGVWVIAILPLLQFAIVYAVFGILGTQLVPGIQWAILAAPAILGVLLAAADRKTLIDKGYDAPTLVAGFIPPLYLILRAVRVGGTSGVALVLWIVFQLVAAAGVYFLMPTVLAAAIGGS